jgi:pimeloyl-ACP methyl ester carboxylesterase
MGGHSDDQAYGRDTRFRLDLAAWCAVIRPDVFRSVSLMSAPFGGAPALPAGGPGTNDPTRIHAELAALDPPRKHYRWYYSTREADDNMRRADELAKMPTYYIMGLHDGMAEAVAPFMPAPAEIADCQWLPEHELAVYSGEFARTGFQGGLQWYRCDTSGINADDLQVFAGRTVDVPCCFIAGARDWGVRQRPGMFQAMQTTPCTKMVGCHLVEGAGHWVQQENSAEVTRLLLEFLK